MVLVLIVGDICRHGGTGDLSQMMMMVSMAGRRPADRLVLITASARHGAPDGDDAGRNDGGIPYVLLCDR